MDAKDIEIIVKKDDEEYHFIVAEEENGFIPVFNVFKKISRNGDKKIAMVESYYMKENKLVKVASGAYEIRGNPMKQIITNYEPEKIEIKKIKNDG
ncbi:hypothetical protein [Metallosphaera javensis (ex Sakai et al. 2022)]|uniref:hypothetical protein n=1 Tax=Metallosphaera javensis (ex Sakai et al. 2022) TaxID=2775498 RepID=UPI00258DFE6B|nr:MAG: hypothetical protein MjAS7_0439 [Metallosphaera javensis (ex Sakai et al. 2022)]